MKKHWSQTPKGRATINRNLRKARAALKRKRKESVHEEISSHHASYLLGRFEAAIEFYCAQQGIPTAPVAAGVAQLLGQHQNR
jgi:hypothetical protein